jgi:hypothetical protein
MARAHVAEAVHHALVVEDAIGGDEILDLFWVGAAAAAVCADPGLAASGSFLVSCFLDLLVLRIGLAKCYPFR